MSRRRVRASYGGVVLTVFLSLRGRSRAAFICLATLALAFATAVPAVAATSAPPTPTGLLNGGEACSTDPGSPVYVSALEDLPLQALSQDTADYTVTEQFQVWPVSDPAQTATFFNEFAITGIEQTVYVPGSTFTDGQTYAWDVQTVTASGTSAWSAPCYVTVDDTAPSSPPTVASSNYPSGQLNQGGTPIQLTLGANGVSDVAGYIFSWAGTLPSFSPSSLDPSFFAPASTVGGSATVNLVPPPYDSSSGLLIFTVASLDRAFNESPPTTFYIWVKQNSPTVTQQNPNLQFDKQGQFHVTADPGLEAASPVVSYTVTAEGQTYQQFTVKASADGTAEFGLTLDDPTGDFITVNSTSADGWTSQGFFWYDSLDTTPTVSSDVYLENQSSGGAGVPGTFTFAPKIKGITSYTYGFSDGTSGSVAVNGTGTAKVTWTPSQSGFNFVDVYGTTKNGIQLMDYFYVFGVN
jgi:hypothetical protein